MIRGYALPGDAVASAGALPEPLTSDDENMLRWLARLEIERAIDAWGKMLDIALHGSYPIALGWRIYEASCAGHIAAAEACLRAVFAAQAQRRRERRAS